jgi:hypothetical protein
MSVKCLMIETSDKKKFFTLVGNQRQLKEYCLAFNAKMFVVKAEIKKSQVMNIPRLVAALCDKSNEGLKADYKVVKQNKTK